MVRVTSGKGCDLDTDGPSKVSRYLKAGLQWVLQNRAHLRITHVHISMLDYKHDMNNLSNPEYTSLRSSLDDELWELHRADVSISAPAGNSALNLKGQGI